MGWVIFSLGLVATFLFYISWQKKSKQRKRLQELHKTWGDPVIQSRSERNISRFFNNSVSQQHTHTLSDRSCNDLDFGALFELLDRTHSKVGQQYLYKQLRQPYLQAENLEPFEKLTDFFQNDTEVRQHTQITLEQLNQPAAYHICTLFQKPLPHKPKWFLLIPFLAVSFLTLLLMAPFFPVLLIAMLPVFILNLFIHYSNKKTMMEVSSGFHQIGPLLKVAEQLLKSQIPVQQTGKTQRAINDLKPLRFRFWLLDNERVQTDPTGLTWAISELIKIAFLLEPLALFNSLFIIRKRTKQLQFLFKFIGQTDSAVSVANYRSSLKTWCLPDFSAGNQEIHAEELTHPLLVNSISNSIHLTQKSLLLTGSNMAGKTTFIRSMALNILMAQTINTCTAKSFLLNPFRIYSAIRITDDLLENKSYFAEEVSVIYELLQAAKQTEPCFFVLDELFKGTNTIERIAAAKGVLQFLHRFPHLVCVSTHDIELTELLKDQYNLYHFSETISDNNLTFDYKLRPGPPKSGNAIRLLELSGYPDEVVSEAQAIAAAFSSGSKSSTAMKAIF